MVSDVSCPSPTGSGTPAKRLYGQSNLGGLQWHHVRASRAGVGLGGQGGSLSLAVRAVCNPFAGYRSRV